MTKSISRPPAAVLAALLVLGACGRDASRQEAWGPTTVAGITFDSPGRLLQITTEVAAAMDTTVRDAVKRVDSYGRTVGGAELRVSRVIYEPTAALSLRGAVQGAVATLDANPAVTGLRHTHVGAQVSGVPALRTSMRMAVQNRLAMGEMLSVLRGQTLWQVHVFGPATPETEALAKRVLDSVRLEPEGK